MKIIVYIIIILQILILNIKTNFHEDENSFFIEEKNEYSYKKDAINYLDSNIDYPFIQIYSADGTIYRDTISRVNLKGEKNKDLIFPINSNGMPYNDRQVHILEFKTKNSKTKKVLFDKNNIVLIKGDYIASNNIKYNMNRFLIEDSYDINNKEEIRIIDGKKYLYDYDGNIVISDTYEFKNGDMYLADDNGVVVENKGIYVYEKPIKNTDGEELYKELKASYVDDDGKVKYIEFFEYNDKYYFADDNGYLYKNKYLTTKYYFDENFEIQSFNSNDFEKVFNDCFVSYLNGGDELRIVDGDINDFEKRINERKKDRFRYNSRQYIYSVNDLDRYINIVKNRYTKTMYYFDGTFLVSKMSSAFTRNNNSFNNFNFDDYDIDEVEEMMIFKDKFLIFDNNRYKGFNNKNGMYYINDGGNIEKNIIVEKTSLVNGKSYDMIFLINKDGQVLRNIKLTKEIVDNNFELKVKNDIINNYLNQYVDNEGVLVNIK